MNHNLPSAPTDFSHIMILLVDDQAIVAESVHRTIMNESDMDFHYCADPGEALALANRIKPMVILQDLVMPQMDGLTLLSRFRANPTTQEVPIVVLSVKEEAAIKSEAFARGANDYLVKLPDDIELRARIRYHAHAYISRLQRNEAFQALRESQQQLMATNTELAASNQQLEQALSKVKQLQGLLPICCVCKKIRDDGNYWQQIETYIAKHTDVSFSHGLCPECMARQMHGMENKELPAADHGLLSATVSE